MPKIIKSIIISLLLITPGFGAINLPLPTVAENPGFLLTHRFFGALGKSDFLGMDSGANVGIGFDAKLRDNFDLALQRFSMNQEYQLTGKLLLLADSAVVFGLSQRAATGITDNKTSLFGQLILSKRFLTDQLRVSLIPGFASATDLNNISAIENDTVALGLAAEYLRKIDYAYFQEAGVAGEINYAVAGYRLSNPTAALGVKVKTWGHIFTLFVTNSFVNSVSGYLPGTDSTSLYFGFNLVRRFSL